MTAPRMTVAHFSDIHCTLRPPLIPWRFLASKRIVGWTNLALRRRYREFADAVPVVEAFTRDVLRLAPDHIISTGDFTAMSLPAEFELAHRALEPLLDRGPGVTAIPGNHDVYVASAARRGEYERCFGRWSVSDVPVESYPARHRHLYPYPLVRFLPDRTVLLALRDVRPRLPHDSSGRVGREQLEALRLLLGDEEIASRRKLLALHYAPRRADSSPDKRLHGLRDADELLRLVDDADVVLAIHGHLHQRYVLAPGAVASAAIANPGSLTSAKHDRTYHVYAFDAEGVSLRVRRYDPSTGEFAAWPQAPGAGRLVTLLAR